MRRRSNGATVKAPSAGKGGVMPAPNAKASPAKPPPSPKGEKPWKKP